MKKSKADKAFEIQEKIGKLINKLDKLGFEFMWYNSCLLYTSTLPTNREV